MTRAAAMIVVMVAGSRETRCRALKCLNMALALSAGARMADSRLLRVSSSGVGQGFFVGTRMPIPAPGTPCPPGPASPAMRTGTGRAARGVWPRSGRGWSRAPPDRCARGTPCDPSPPARCPRTPSPCPSTTGGGPCRGCAERPGRCGSGSRPGWRSAPSIGAAGPGPREGPGPGRRSPPGPHADTCRPWPGSPSSRGPGWSGRCPPPSTSAGARPGTRQVAALCHGLASWALRWAANHRQMVWAMDSGTSKVAG